MKYYLILAVGASGEDRYEILMWILLVVVMIDEKIFDIDERSAENDESKFNID